MEILLQNIQLMLSDKYDKYAVEDQKICWDFDFKAINTPSLYHFKNLNITIFRTSKVKKYHYLINN